MLPTAHRWTQIQIENHHLAIPFSISFRSCAVTKTNPCENLQKYLALVSLILIKNRSFTKNGGNNLKWDEIQREGNPPNTQKCHLFPAPPKTCVRNNWKGPGGSNCSWWSGDQVARSTITKFRRQDTTSWGQRREPVTGQVQYQNRTPWVSATRDLHSSLIEIPSRQPHWGRNNSSSEPASAVYTKVRARTVLRGMAFPKDTVLANHKSNRNDRQIPRVRIPTAGVRWLGVTGHFKCP